MGTSFDFQGREIMEERLVALDLFLEALGVPPDIETVVDRKRVQKAVYVGQRAGVDLGYSYSWYLMGPYSTSLTRDYYALADALASGAKARVQEHKLQPELEKRLKAIRPLLTPPRGVGLDDESWLELIASYDYLRKVSNYSHAKALETLQERKSHLVPYVAKAVEALGKYSLN
jgi:uncharacterized protein YwgA